jgi:hypothetical protein
MKASGGETSVSEDEGFRLEIYGTSFEREMRAIKIEGSENDDFIHFRISMLGHQDFEIKMIKR